MQWTRFSGGGIVWRNVPSGAEAREYLARVVYGLKWLRGNLRLWLGSVAPTGLGIRLSAFPRIPLVVRRNGRQAPSWAIFAASLRDAFDAISSQGLPAFTRTLKPVHFKLTRSLGTLIFSGSIFLVFVATWMERGVWAQAVPAAVQNGAPPFTVLHANANLVLVDVVAADHGKPVEGLKQGDFHLLENGKEQAIFSFEEHGPALAPDAGAQPPNDLPAGMYTNLPAFPEQGAVNVLLVDALNTRMGDQLRVRQQMMEYLSQIKPGTTLAVFTLTSRLRMISGFTANVAYLAELMRSTKLNNQQSLLLGTGNTGAQLDQTNQADQVSTALQGGQTARPSIANVGSGGLTNGPINAAAALQQFEADTVTGQTDVRVRETLDALNQLAEYLSGIPGRKNLIWLSGSFPLAIAPDSSLFSSFRAISNYRDDVQKTCDLLTQARVAVYPVGAQGLRGPEEFSAANTYAAPGQAQSTQWVKGKGEMDEEFGSMDEIADETGGRAFDETNQLADAVADAVENGSHYYTIGYVPAADLNGQFRKIQVRLEGHDVEGHDYKLAYRRGYYADGPEAPAQHTIGNYPPLVAAALHGAPAATQIVFKAGLLLGSDPLLKNVQLPEGPAGEMAGAMAKPVRYVVNLTLNPRSLNLQVTPDGRRYGKIELALIGYDADGNVSNYVDRPLTLGLQPAQYARIESKGISLLLPIDLPAGDDSVRIAVEDLTASRAGSLEIPVTVTAQ
jgi:VWFA-related protein